MKRTQIYLDEGQDRRLAKRAKNEGVTKSTLIRQAIDAYLDKPDDEAAALVRFRAAIDSAAGCAPYLSDGKSYVEELRRNDKRRQDDLEKRWRG